MKLKVIELAYYMFLKKGGIFEFLHNRETSEEDSIILTFSLITSNLQYSPMFLSGTCFIASTSKKSIFAQNNTSFFYRYISLKFHYKVLTYSSIFYHIFVHLISHNVWIENFATNGLLPGPDTNKTAIASIFNSRIMWTTMGTLWFLHTSLGHRSSMSRYS